MFKQACATIRESVYGIIGRTRKKTQKKLEVTLSNGSGFMIAPDTIITAAHLTHMNSDVNQPNYNEFLLIRAPDIGQSFEIAQLIAEDPIRDVAILHLKS